jgi:hypothetical protein
MECCINKPNLYFNLDPHNSVGNDGKDGKDGVFYSFWTPTLIFYTRLLTPNWVNLIVFHQNIRHP